MEYLAQQRLEVPPNPPLSHMYGANAKCIDRRGA